MSEPEVLEHGRYKLGRGDDGSLIIARATGTCDSCSSCQCGEQQGLVIIPGMMVRLAQAAQDGKLSPLAALRGMIRHGRAGDESAAGPAADEGGGDPVGAGSDPVRVGLAAEEAGSRRGRPRKGAAGRVRPADETAGVP